jgi:phage tail-like protein
MEHMLTDFVARHDIHSHLVNLLWTWTEEGNERPEFKLLRRQRCYANSIDDGTLVADFKDLNEVLGVSNAQAMRLERHAFIDHNATIESGMFIAELWVYYADNDTQDTPIRLTITIKPHDDSDAFTIDIINIVRVARTHATTATWKDIETWKIFISANGETEISAGQIDICLGHQDGITPNRFLWSNPETETHQVNFQCRVTIDLNERYNSDHDQWIRQINVLDGGLEPNIDYYYTLFAPVVDQPGEYYSERYWRTIAKASDHYDFASRLYGLLPSLHRFYDEPDRDSREKGPLRKYLQVFGAVLDQVRSTAESLSNRHDINNVRADVLPRMARWLGWEPDQTLDIQQLRTDIVQAPEVYRSIGTIPNLSNMVKRVTGWDCQIKEFVHNVFLTNAPEQIRLWEIWQHSIGGRIRSYPSPVTQTDSFDGCPSVATGGEQTSWLFFHSHRGGLRQIWMQPFGTSESACRPAVLHTRDQSDEASYIASYIDEYPCALASENNISLFWSSNRNGRWDIWTAHDTNLANPFSESSEIGLLNLTDHLADDRHPTAVSDSRGNIYLFWQSNRRGPTDIWMRTGSKLGDGTMSWRNPTRVTSAVRRHEQPAAMIDEKGRIWLFWVEDLGDRQNLSCMINDSDNPAEKPKWSKVFAITNDNYRNESPAAVLWQNQIALLWNRVRLVAQGNNILEESHILGQYWKWRGGQNAPESNGEPFNVASETTADKEPTAIVDNKILRILWRSQRRGRCYQSRTVDTKDYAMVKRLGTLEDRAHYTYDTRKTDSAWYARDTIGVCLTTDSAHEDTEKRSERLLKGPLNQFLPANIRPVLFLRSVDWEYVYSEEAPLLDDSDVTLTSPYLEGYEGLDDSYTDKVPQWKWLRAWSIQFPDARAVDFNTTPIDTHWRTWHVGLKEGD